MATDGEWHQTACILCSANCGVEVRLDGRRFARVRGDKANVESKGYTCEKALRLDHYQNGRHRLTHPLRRQPDGSYERIDWDTAIREVAEGFARIRDEHGGSRIFYYGGGGQGNHLGGGYSSSTRDALGITYSSNALAQEKTGEFWVDSRLFGASTCHTAGDYEHAQVAVFWGKNPWQSHGFPRARVLLKEIAKDQDRTLVVVDPKRSETAELADIHLAPRPGGDGFLLAALVAALFEGDLIDPVFIAERTVGIDAVEAAFARIDIDDYARRAGVDPADLRQVARVMGEADSVSVFEDLGIQMAPHSTMNSYLEKLAVMLTGNFAKRGGMNLHTIFGPLFGNHDDRTTPVTGHRLVTGLVPCNVIPDEIATEHPDRFRAMLVESSNPAHSLAESARWREAFEALEFSVVIDVTMSETARLADYVLPASSQFEKWETTFFNLEFPENTVQLRAPLLEPEGDTLPEPEIHTRLCRELGAISDAEVVPLREAAERGREEFTTALFTAVGQRPELSGLLAVLLHETLGTTLPGGRAPAAMWGLAQRVAGMYPESIRRAGFDNGDELFDAVLAGRSGVVFSVDDYDETWARIKHADGKVHLDVPELLDEMADLEGESLDREADWPLILAAGERRSSSANTIFRDPDWRKKDREGALHVHPEDAAVYGLSDGGRARVITATGEAEALVELHDGMQPGFISLPNGFGLDHPGGDGDAVAVGVAPNELTDADSRDWFAGTPHHKHVPARLEPLNG
ncbi:MAG: molybdopterin-dependent oxidoreductase [Actinomycetia bacterium]|nr:molybdopterin-dependent oxidoreductase [Actinomycetes bacterium]